MMRRTISVVAVCVYGVVVALAMWQGRVPAQTQMPEKAAGQSPAAIRQGGLPYRSIGIQLQRVDWMDNKYRQSVDEVAGVGADTVLFVVDARQENGSSSQIFLDMRKTPTPEQLGGLISYSKQKGLRVILMPIVLLESPQGNEWRGNMNPRSWSEWFDSYRDMMNHFAWIAEVNGVDVLVVGSELVSSEKFVDEWRRTIREIREVFKGQLTYSSNWDHYVAVPFWDQLDLIGMNSYWRLDRNERGEGMRNRVTVEMIENNWRQIQQDLFKFQKKMDKPLLFLEVGWCSLANAAHEPWDYTKASEPIDLDLQRRLYEGFFRSWHGRQELGGFSIWAWSPDGSGEQDRGYTPKGKPAEAVLREWLAKPRWQVE